jgi:glycosyltransferase involved in cell wall biosynthesis
MIINFIHWQYSTFPEDFPEHSPGGAENAIWEIAKRVSKKHKVRIFCLGEKNFISYIEGIEFIRIQAPIILRSKWTRPDYYFYKAMKQINEEAKKEKQIVHCVTCIEPAAFANKKVRVILNMHNEIKKYLPYPSFKRKFYENKIRRIDFVTGVSNFIINSFLDYFIFDRKKTKTIYNGADFKIFNPKNRNKKEIYKNYGLDDKKLLLYFGGRIIQRKGLHLLIDAIKGLDVNLIVTGVGDRRQKDKEYYEKIIGLMKNSKNIRFAGDVDEKERGKILSSSDIAFCPSIWDDPSPLICYEAQAAGVPVIGFRRGGIPELIENRKTGIICDEKTLRKEIIKLIKNKNKIKQMSKNAYKKARKEFDWDKVAKEYFKLYMENNKNEHIN